MADRVGLGPGVEGHRVKDEKEDLESKAFKRKISLSFREKKYFKVGIWLTSIFLLCVTCYCFVVWKLILAMTPNEVGDFLAGIFGPLALLWVVLGFLQQGAELRYSRDALILQAKELRSSVLTQKNMAEAAWAAVEIDKQDRNDKIREQNTYIVLEKRKSIFKRAFNVHTIRNRGGACSEIRIFLLWKIENDDYEYQIKNLVYIKHIDESGSIDIDIIRGGYSKRLVVECLDYFGQRAVFNFNLHPSYSSLHREGLSAERIASEAWLDEWLDPRRNSR